MLRRVLPTAARVAGVTFRPAAAAVTRSVHTHHRRLIFSGLTFGAALSTSYALCEEASDRSKQLSALRADLKEYITCATAFFQVMDRFYERKGRLAVEARTLSPTDLREVLTDLGCPKSLTQRAVSEFFSLFDVNNNGKIDFIETCVAMTQLADMTEQDKVKMLFLACDVDKSDTVDRDELRHMLRYLFDTRSQLLGETPLTRRRGDEYIDIPRRYIAQHQANITTNEVFKAANVKEGGELRFQQFQFWLKKGGPLVEFVLQSMTDPADWEKTAKGKVASMRKSGMSGSGPKIPQGMAI